MPSADERNIGRTRRTALCIAVFFGLLFVFINPPFQVDDEYAHMWRVYDFTTGRVLSRADDKGPYVLWPQAGFDYLTRYKYLRKADNRHFSPTRVLADFRTPWSERAPRRDVAYAADYSPVCYLPQIPAVWLARMLSLPVAFHLYLARLFALLANVWMLSVALRWMRDYQWALIPIALLPMTLWQAVGVTADGMTNSLCFLSLAWFVQMAVYRKGRVTPIELVLTTLLLSMLGLCKYAYGVCGLIFFMVPRERFLTAWRRVMTIGSCGVVSVFPVILWVLANSGRKPAQTKYDGAAQMHQLLSDPRHFVAAVLRTLREDAGMLTRMFVGHFGRFNRHVVEQLAVPWSAVALGVGLLVFASVSVSVPNHVRVARSASRMLIAVATLMALAIFLGFYLLGTRSDSGYISGVQGRYFIPVAACLLLASAIHNPRGTTAKAWSTKLIFLGLIILLCSAVGVILRVYYV